MKKFLPSLFIFALLLTTCGTDTTQTVTGDEPTPDPLETLVPTDWSVDHISDETITFHSTITNPSSGALLSTYLVIPKGDKGTEFKTVFLVPGALGYGSNAYKGNSSTEMFLLEHTIAYAYFDPDGRGESTGEEDANGEIHQDGLLAVSLAVAEHEAVDPENFGIASYSYGTAMVAGMLGRYGTEAPYKWYVDWEGPSNREYVTIGCEDAAVRPQETRILATDCDDDDFWHERESVNFLPSITIPYLRVQGVDDHVQTSNEHAIDAINAAAGGTGPWTRINDEDPNQTYTYENPPEYLQQSKTDTYILELFELF